MTTQVHWLGAAIGEVTCPAKYMREAPSINFRRSIRYGFGCLGTGVRYRLARWRLASPLVRETREKELLCRGRRSTSLPDAP